MTDSRQNRLPSIEELELWLSRSEHGTDFLASYGLPRGWATQLLDTLRENERFKSVIKNLEPLRNIDWHGKWRIHRALDAVHPNKHTDHCEDMLDMVKPTQNPLRDPKVGDTFVMDGAERTVISIKIS